MNEGRIEAEKDDDGWPVWRDEMLAEASREAISKGGHIQEPLSDEGDHVTADVTQFRRRRSCVPFTMVPNATVLKAFLPGGCVPFAMRGPRP